MENTATFIILLVELAILVFVIMGMWKAFEKAGEKGWACLVPFYNVYVMCRIAGRPGWWFLLLLIPLIGLIVLIVVSIDIAKNFGKGTGFGVGLALLAFIFWPILGFGDSQYRGVRSAPA